MFEGDESHGMESDIYCKSPKNKTAGGSKIPFSQPGTLWGFFLQVFHAIGRFCYLIPWEGVIQNIWSPHWDYWVCETYTLNCALDGHLESSLDISYIRGRQISSNSSTGCTGRWDARTVQRNSHLYFWGEISTGQSLPFKLGSAVRNGKDDQRYCSTHWTLPCPKNT